MKTLKTFALAAFTFALFSCGGDKKTDSIPTGSTETAVAADESTAEMEATAAKYDPNRGLGKHENVDVSTFDPAMAAAGKKWPKLNVPPAINQQTKNWWDQAGKALPKDRPRRGL
ncbi:hypothetical protein [Kaistella sp. 97-N-M2]|uniref:hypothetical protein n=1 Tax=Kaistella sp. 97-N-M2 TaxID=2908645 RepID=UPI0038B2BA1D